MSVSVVETFTCDGCGASEARSSKEPSPAGWGFLGYLDEPHSDGHLLLCSLCLQGTGLVDRLKRQNEQHRQACNREPPLDDEVSDPAAVRPS